MEDAISLRQAQLEREMAARRGVAQIIFETGSVGLPFEYLMKEMRARGVGRVGFRNDLGVVLEKFVGMGMIGVRKDNVRGVEGYYWKEPLKQVSDYSHLI